MVGATDEIVERGASIKIALKVQANNS